MARVAFKATPEVVSQPNLGTDLTVGLLMLALDARYLKNRVMALRRHEPLRSMVPRALALIIAEPGGICEDIGVVVDHLVTSPFRVTLALRLPVVRLRAAVVVSAVRRARGGRSNFGPGESGEGVAWHVALLAGAACAGTLVASGKGAARRAAALGGELCIEGSPGGAAAAAPGTRRAVCRARFEGRCYVSSSG